MNWRKEILIKEKTFTMRVVKHCHRDQTGAGIVILEILPSCPV